MSDLTPAALLASLLDPPTTSLTRAELNLLFGSTWLSAAHHLLLLGLIDCYTRGSGTSDDVTTVYSVRGLKRWWRQVAPAQMSLRFNPRLSQSNGTLA